ncbi:MAG: hypothetical protein H0W34_12970 [Pyrinomonadaceae bacterium]|nr:hypothetical protein [Pyrinomonadaceae bacterium]
MSTKSGEVQKAILLAELTPSMQVFVACGTALDALYEQLKPFAKISEEDIKIWRENKTSRAAQIAEIIRRVYKLNKDIFKAFRNNIKSIIKYRDEAVHPTHEIKRTCTRPDVPVELIGDFLHIVIITVLFVTEERWKCLSIYMKKGLATRK